MLRYDPSKTEFDWHCGYRILLEYHSCSRVCGIGWWCQLPKHRLSSLPCSRVDKLTVAAVNSSLMDKVTGGGGGRWEEGNLWRCIPI